METYSVVLTFESVDEILWCDHSNETSSAVLLYGTSFSIFYKMKFEIFLVSLILALAGVSGLRRKLMLAHDSDYPGIIIINIGFF